MGFKGYAKMWTASWMRGPHPGCNFRITFPIWYQFWIGINFLSGQNWTEWLPKLPPTAVRVRVRSPGVAGLILTKEFMIMNWRADIMDTISIGNVTIRCRFVVYPTSLQGTLPPDLDMFQSFFNKMLMLHYGILLPLLVKLNDCLENIQACWVKSVHGWWKQWGQ
jgi:hypothetical protein